MLMLKRLSKHTNDKGMTMVELLVAMAISSVLLVGMVAASAFLQRYISTWQNRSKLMEELSFTLRSITRHVEQARSVRLGTRRIDLESDNGTRTSIEWTSGTLLVNRKSMTTSTFRIDSVGIAKLPLYRPTPDTILSTGRGQSVPGMYQVTIVGSTAKGLTDTLSTIARCNYEYFKYAP